MGDGRKTSTGGMTKEKWRAGPRGDATGKGSAHAKERKRSSVSALGGGEAARR